MGRWSSATFDEANDISCLRLHNAVLVCRDLDAACTGVANDASCLVRMVAQHSWPHVAAMCGAAHLIYRAAEAYGSRGCGDLCCAVIRSVDRARGKNECGTLSIASSLWRCCRSRALLGDAGAKGIMPHDGRALS